MAPCAAHEPTPTFLLSAWEGGWCLSAPAMPAISTCGAATRERAPSRCILLAALFRFPHGGGPAHLCLRLLTRMGLPHFLLVADRGDVAVAALLLELRV